MRFEYEKDGERRVYPWWAKILWVLATPLIAMLALIGGPTILVLLKLQSYRDKAYWRKIAKSNRITDTGH